MAAFSIRTDRLILRPPEPQDFEPWADFLGDSEVMRFLGGAQPPPVAWRSFCGTAGAWALYGFGMFSVIETGSDRWIGRVGPLRPLGWPGTEVGWGLAREAQGRGYALEAAVAAIDWAFDTLGWTEVIHTIDPDNVASQAVARRLGSENQGPGQLPPPFEDQPVDIWGLTRQQWRERRALS